MRFSSPNRSPKALWSRFAAFLSFVAVFSALVAPASMLAEEVRTGKLAGLCLVKTSLNGSGDVGGDFGNTSSHCDACTSLAYALPPLLAQPLPSQPGQPLAGVGLTFDLTARISGLPPSRGPPAL